MIKWLLVIVKLAISLAILVYVVDKALRDNPTIFSELAQQSKNWNALAAAWCLCFAAVTTTIVRWYLLVRALELPFRVRDAFRLGFFGFLCNLVSLGSVGGDLFKAIFIAREQPGRRTEAVSTVVVDRVVGFYGLLLLTSVVILSINLEGIDREIKVVCNVALLGTAVGTVLVGLFLRPGFTTGPASEFLSQLPRIGSMLERLIGALRMYRRKLPVLGIACAMSVGTHSLFAVGVYMIANGLLAEVPLLSEHFLIVPLGTVVGAVPLPLGALGAYEGGMEILYEHVPLAKLAAGDGLLVALGYRIVTVAIAMVGVCFYLANRREMTALLREADGHPSDEPPAC